MSVCLREWEYVIAEGQEMSYWIAKRLRDVAEWSTPPRKCLMYILHDPGALEAFLDTPAASTVALELKFVCRVFYARFAMDSVVDAWYRRVNAAVVEYEAHCERPRKRCSSPLEIATSRGAVPVV